MPKIRLALALLLLIALAAAVACGGPPRPKRAPSPAALAESTDAPVIAYLSALGDDAVGSELEGVEIDLLPPDPEADPEDQLDPEEGVERVLEDDVYLGRVPGLPDGVHVHLVERDDEVLAYLWVEPGAPSLALPECEADRPGFRATRLWGAIYTWRAARPGDGVLISHCPQPAWVEAVSESG